jgi:predicted dehydrogenase/nucleoside-diphosphate-sugar epimerase
MMKKHKVCLIGTGNIAETHAAVLREIDGVELVGVADLNQDRAQAFAARWGATRVFADLRALVEDGTIGVVHVLVPPPSHRSVAEPLLRGGLDVLIEKPMATTVEDCDALVAAARMSGAALGVNHNYLQHPTHLGIRRSMSTGAIGPVRHAVYQFSMPLLPLTARQFGHWIFEEPRNLLLEQAVHPLSQIENILGPASELSSLAGPSLYTGPSGELRSTWLISLICARGTAQLLYSVGESYPSWGATIIGDDGAIHADYVANRLWHETPHKWLEALSIHRAGIDASAEIRRQSWRNLASYVASTLKLKPRSDGFFASMKGSIGAFYSALDGQRAALDGLEGRRVVALCERIASGAPSPQVKNTHAMVAQFASESVNVEAFAGVTTPAKAYVAAAFDRTAPFPYPDTAAIPVTEAATSFRRRGQSPPNVAVLGGTGFIGMALVSALVGRGMRVAVMARNPGNLLEGFGTHKVEIYRGDIARREDVARTISGATAVVNLAHAGGATALSDIERAIVGGAMNLAELCLENRVQRLIHVSSIAALYLGDPNAVIVGKTPCDPLPDRRESYSRAKAIAECRLLRLCRERDLRICIVRPGIVVGKGGLPFHSGVGFYNNERHCLGWNRGENPLPFVLVDDVADAIVRALEAPSAVGRTYNLVGNVQLTAREYVAELARALDRPLEYHPQSLAKLYAVELSKWMVKRAIGRRDESISYRDLRSRGLVSRFDCTDAERDLGWQPVSDRRTFIQRGIEVHARVR